MANWTTKERDAGFDQSASALEQLVESLGPILITNPEAGEALVNNFKAQLDALLATQVNGSAPNDLGLAELVGLGPGAAPELGDTFATDGVEPFDEQITSERLLALADLYYIYQHEVPIGVFRAVLKLQELFQAGTVRLSSGKGAGWLYQYDRQEVLRFTQKERYQGYLRAFGYSKTAPAPGATPNRDFHRLFSNFNNRVAIYWRDKRISEVIRQNASDPSYGSIAIVRRAGLDLRHNLKHFSYGHLNAMRVELLPLLKQAFRILGADDVMHLYGAGNAWDVIEEIYLRYFKRTHTNISARNAMAINGRDILRWLAQPYVLQTDRNQFEALLQLVAGACEEWLISAESVGAARFMRPDQTSSAMTGPRTYPVRAAESEFELMG
jgi:hypothetical protein